MLKRRHVCERQIIRNWSGPGDPDLLTIKAINAIHKYGVIAVPKTRHGERTAFSIIERYLNGKELLECRFVMDKDIAKRKEDRQMAAGMNGLFHRSG